MIASNKFRFDGSPRGIRAACPFVSVQRAAEAATNKDQQMKTLLIYSGRALMLAIVVGLLLFFTYQS